MKPFTMLASTFALGLFAVTVSATEPSDAPRSLTVRYADLNLDSEAGAAALYKRIHGAARSVCGPTSTPSLQERRAYNECIQSAVQEAIAKVDRPMLTQYAAMKSEAPVRVASGK